MANDASNDFGQYRRLILKELERLNGAYESLRRIVEDIRRDDLPKLRTEFREEIQKVKKEILADIKPNSAVQAAKITGTWQIYVMLISSATAVIVAIIALLQSN